MRIEAAGSRWAGHLAAAQRAGKSLAQYAREQGLSVSSLYMARHEARSASARSVLVHRSGSRSVGPGRAKSAFSAVRVWPERAAASPATLRARLPNGIALECVLNDASGMSLQAVLRAMAQLPCSD